MRTIYYERLEYLVETVNKRIAPLRITVRRKKTGKSYEYTAYIENEIDKDWICTGTYRELIVALYAIYTAEWYIRRR